MNNVKYANFKKMYNLKNINLVYDNDYQNVFAGMYFLIVLVKDGFAGVAEIIQTAEEEYIVKLKSDVHRALNKLKK